MMIYDLKHGKQQLDFLLSPGRLDLFPADEEEKTELSMSILGLWFERVISISLGDLFPNFSPDKRKSFGVGCFFSVIKPPNKSPN